jgi:hypothetical protein
LVRDVDIEIKPDFADYKAVSENDTVSMPLEIGNFGNNVLRIESMELNEELFVEESFPIEVDPFSEKIVDLYFTSEEKGVISDSILITTNDPMHSSIILPYAANVQKYFQIVDNEDSTKYSESGDWKTSVTQAYGNSSRYVYIHGNTGAFAEFTTKLDFRGVYDIQQMVPNTTNSANQALYVVYASGNPVDSAYINQNSNSGNWITVSQSTLPANTPVSIRVINDGSSTDGDVLRADAVKFQLVEKVTSLDKDKIEKPTEYSLHQNYPNPFNSTTNIEFSIPENSDVEIAVYDVLGREVRTLLNANKQAGNYSLKFDASDLSGGIYFYTLKTQSNSITKKMIYLK